MNEAIFNALWVRKLTGKPALLTIADSESEAPRIQKTDDDHAALSIATESRAFRIHSDLLSADLAIAAFMVLCSSGEIRAWIRTARRFSSGIFAGPFLCS